jgi:hypothetical protein
MQITQKYGNDQITKKTNILAYFVKHSYTGIFFLFLPAFLLPTTSCSNQLPMPGITRLVLIPKAGQKAPSLAEMSYIKTSDLTRLDRCEI